MSAIAPLRDGRLAGHRCLVVGSAPNAADIRPERWGWADRVLAANGGVRVAEASGAMVDALVTTSYLFRAAEVSDQERATRRAMFGCSVKTVYLDLQAGQPTVPLASGGGISYQWLVGVSTARRAEVVVAACGAPLRVSSGVWAVCLAVASGAADVEMAGFSFEPGHVGMSWDAAPRDHVEEDRECLAHLVARGLRWDRSAA